MDFEIKIVENESCQSNDYVIDEELIVPEFHTWNSAKQDALESIRVLKNEMHKIETQIGNKYQRNPATLEPPDSGRVLENEMQTNLEPPECGRVLENDVHQIETPINNEYQRNSAKLEPNPVSGRVLENEMQIGNKYQRNPATLEPPESGRVLETETQTNLEPPDSGRVLETETQIGNKYQRNPAKPEPPDSGRVLENEMQIGNKYQRNPATLEPPESGRVLENEMHQIETLTGNRYHLIRVLGKGAQGKVFLAINCETHQKVAIKQLLIQSIKDWKLYDLFQREAQTLKRLDISGVAKFYETMEFLDVETPMALIVQEFLEGDTLQSFIAKGHRFRIEQIGEILLQLTDILEKLHKSTPSVIHRDLKPSNIILSYDDSEAGLKVHIIDFGAVANPQVKGGGSTVVGTYGYMAPEQLMGCAEPKSDIYSLAIIAVYLMTGVPPELLEIEDFRVLIDAHLEHLPHAVTVFLRSMLEPKCQDRMGDYALIRKFFKAIRKQDFNAIPLKSGIRSAKAGRDYSLKKVLFYRQEGNIELWQALSDKTPRKIPGPLFRESLLECLITLYDNNIQLDNNIQKKRTIYGIIITVYLMGLGICILNGLFNTKASAFVIIISSNLLILIYMLDVINTTLMKKQLVWIGRKSMATVVRIEYIPIPPDKITNNLDQISSWKLSYSFNPPDDKSPDPIVHSFITHAYPKTIKEGDLIPILYLIKHDKKGEWVESMPYPFAHCDEYDNVITIGKEI